MKSNQIRRAFAALAAIATASISFSSSTIIARLNPGFDPQLVAAALGIRYLDSSAGGRHTLFGTSSEEQSEQIEALLIATPNPIAVWAEDDNDLTITESTNGKGGGVPQLRRGLIQTQYSQGNSYAENTAMLQQIHWNYQTPVFDQRIRVAVLDTGLSPLQPLIWSQVVASATMIPRERNAWDYRLSPGTNNSHFYQDIAGHGTMVAGLIHILAPDAELVIVRVCDNYGRSDSWKIIKGLAFALENGAVLANMSFGSIGQPNALEYAIEDAEIEGLVCIAPLGNNNLNQIMYPARNNHTIAVSGIDNLDIKASFSNWHGGSDLASPSTGIRSAWWNGQMAIWHGTSFGVPIVTGCIAEALKNRGPVQAQALVDSAGEMGDDIDLLNPLYATKLGFRINMDKVRAVIANLP
jgi:hypothetical protein